MGPYNSKSSDDVDSDSDSSGDDDKMDNTEPRNDDMKLDAVGQLSKKEETYKILKFDNITITTVVTVENELDLYEKISLIYLLFDDPFLAMDEIQLLIDGTHKLALTEWATINETKNSDWKKKLVEGLSVIQNFKILKQLGYKKTDITNEFFPTRPCFTSSLNKIKKCMFCIFDNFLPEETQRIIDLAVVDLKKIPCQKNQYFEYICMFFESIGYISPTNVNNFLKHLKVMEKELEYSNLNLTMKLLNNSRIEINEPVDITSHCMQGYVNEVPLNKTGFIMDKTTASVPSVDYSTEVSPSTSKEIKTKRKVSIHDPEKCYEMNPNSPGICLIINNEYFYTEFDPTLKDLIPEEVSTNKIENRQGTEFDKTKLELTFKQFGFTVISHNNKTHQQIEEIVKHTAHNIVTAADSSMFICILSHGLEGKIIGSNSIPVEVKNLKRLLCSKQLLGKPKILILQSCQGNEIQKIAEHGYASDGLTTDSPLVDYTHVPKTSDFYELWATVPGYAAIRNINSGTWLIQTLCKMMMDYPEYHFVDICNMVKHEINTKYWEHKNEEGIIEKRVMVAQDTSTLHNFLYLPPLKK